MKHCIAFLLTLSLMVCVFTGCGSSSSQPDANTTQDPAESAATLQPGDNIAEEEEENYDTGDASLDDPLNQDGIGETELLVVSFGTSFNDSRRLTIGAIEKAMIDAFPDVSVRRGFTSQIIIDHVMRRDGEVIDNITQALERAVANGVKNLVVQPTHLMHGFEYNDVVDELATYAGAFDKIEMGEPILNSEDDFKTVAKAIVDATREYDDGQTAIVFMGHGTGAGSNAVYAQMQQVLSDMGMENYYIGTVEATPSVDDVLTLVQAGNYKNVVLEPLMIVAGDHANNDMAGDEEGSWKTIFEGAGYKVTCILRGLGEFEEIQKLLVQHAQTALNSITPAKVATAKDMTEVVDVLEEGMTPIYAGNIKDGVYAIDMKSSSSMFKADHCELVVADGRMSAILYMASESYSDMFAGRAAKAAIADPSEYIPLTENADGTHSFSLPVEALDAGIECSAFSKRKELWYDRTLLFRAASLPLDAFADGFLTTPERLGLADGAYTVDVRLVGGSGRSSIASPAKLTVAGGSCMAEVVWSSSNYDYMKVDGEQYLPVNAEGSSTFVIPVLAFDFPMAVLADTTAMSQPHEIAYTLFFDSSTIHAAS